jgi:hypothetical protein
MSFILFLSPPPAALDISWSLFRLALLLLLLLLLLLPRGGGGDFDASCRAWDDNGEGGEETCIWEKGGTPRTFKVI